MKVAADGAAIKLSVCSIVEPIAKFTSNKVPPPCCFARTTIYSFLKQRFPVVYGMTESPQIFLGLKTAI